MPSRENPISNSSQIDLDIFRPDVNQHGFKAAISRVEHHLQIILSRHCGFNGEALVLTQVLRCRFKDMAGSCHREQPGRRGLERIRDGVGVEERNLPE